MSISTREFETAMKLMGAERQNSTSLSVLSFKLGTTKLVHCGGNYATYKDDMLPKEIVDNAIQILGTKQRDIIWNEIHSTKGLVVLVLLLKGEYNKEIFNSFIDKIYRKLFNNSLLQKQYSTALDTTSPKSNILESLLMQYDKVINPYYSLSSVKPASAYSDKLKLDLTFDSNSMELPNIKVNATTSLGTTAEFTSSPFQVAYYAEYLNDESTETYTGYKSFKHTYIFDYNCALLDEFLLINIHSPNEEDSSLSINLFKGLIWSSDNPAIPLTDTHIELLINYLKECVSRIQKCITSTIV